MSGLCQLTAQDLWFRMIHQQWPWFIFREFLFEMYLDLDKLLQVDPYRKSGHQKPQLLWGGFMWLLDFKATKLVLIFHLRALNTIVCEPLLLPLIFPLSHFLQCPLKYTSVFSVSEVLAIWKPWIADHSSSSHRKHWMV